MHGSGRSQGWLIHLMAGAALGAVIVLVVWIFSGGRPFGEVVGTSDVSAPTRAATAPSAPAPAAAAATLKAQPPALKRKSSSAVRFLKPSAERKAKAKPAAKAKRKQRAKRKRRTPVVRVVAPPSSGQPVAEAPVAAVPSPAAAPPAPAAPPAGSGGGGAAKPKSPGPTLWAGEG